MHPGQNARAGVDGCAAKLVGAAGFGGLRQGDKQRGLRRSQAARFLAEIGARGGAQTFEIATKRRAVEVKRQDLILAKPPFQRQGDPDLP